MLETQVPIRKEAQTISHNLIFISFVACYMFWPLGKPPSGSLKVKIHDFPKRQNMQQAIK
jgi:hypothetical protein